MSVPVFGEESNRLDQESGISYNVTNIYTGTPRHTHNFYEFFIVADGSAYHYVNDSVQTIRKGDFFFVRPKDVHCYYFYHSENFCIHNLGFSQRIFHNISLFLNQDKKLNQLTEAPFPPWVHLEEERFSKVMQYMTEVGALERQGHPAHTRYHAQCVAALFLEDYFFTYEEAYPDSRMPFWLSQLLIEMAKVENFQAGYEKMCSLAPCSPNHLCRMLKQTCGQTPTQYINHQRLKYAVYLLTQTEEEILDICEACGFSNVSHFYHLFQKEFGKSPIKFRKTFPGST